MEALTEIQAFFGDVKGVLSWVYQNSTLLLTVGILDLLLCFMGLLWLKAFIWKNKWFLTGIAAVIVGGYAAASANIF